MPLGQLVTMGGKQTSDIDLIERRHLEVARITSVQDGAMSQRVFDRDPGTPLILGHEGAHPVPPQPEINCQLLRRMPFVLRIESQQPRERDSGLAIRKRINTDRVEYRKSFGETLRIRSQLKCWSVEETLMSGLFEEANRLEAIPLPDAEVYYQSNFDLGRHPDEILRDLISDVPWRQHKILVWGKVHLQPRLVAWYGDPDTVYTYSGITLEPLPWTDLLLDIKKRVETVTAASFNSVLLNYYRDNRDSMGFHSDFEPVLGDRPEIASVSLGEERTFILKHKTNKLAKPVRLRLASGSLLLMKGETQRYWQHGIAKQTRPCGPRINLTFRRILT